MSLTVTVPANTTAEVHLPKLGLRNASLTEGGRTLWRDGLVPGFPGITSARERPEEFVLEVGSGTYRFAVTGARTPLRP